MPRSTRTRTMGEPFAFNATGYQAASTVVSGSSFPWCNGWGGTVENFQFQAASSNYARIDDEVGPYPFGAYPQSRVGHEKWRYSLRSTYYPSRGMCGALWTITGTPRVPYLIAFSARNLRPPDGEYSQFCDEAYHTLTAQFPTEVSIANFMWELRELQDLIPKIQGGLTDIVANGYLTLNFGWLPLIGDLQKLYNIGKTVKTRLDYLRARWGRKTRLGTSKRVNVAKPPIGPIALNASAGAHIRGDVTRCETTYRAGGRLFHTLEWVNQANAEWHALIGALGFLDPLAIVWEAIPYSFVVDWVIGMDSWINRYWHLVEEPDHWNISGLCGSRKTVIEVNIVQVNSTEMWQGTRFEDRLLGTFSYSSYDRSPGLLTSSSFDRVGLVTPKQLALLAALGVGHT